MWHVEAKESVTAIACFLSLPQRRTQIPLEAENAKSQGRSMTETHCERSGTYPNPYIVGANIDMY